MKKLILLSVALLMLLVVPGFTHAQSSAACFSFNNNLRLGSSDSFSGGEVTKLQTFLQAQGYFTRPPTGYFGGVTLAAVIHFQKDHGVSSTGFVGLMTRAAISKRCGVDIPPSQGSVQLSSLSRTSGMIDNQVTIYGSGFTNDNTIHFGYGAIVHVAATNNGTQLTFNVPSYLTPACYYSTPRCLIATQQTLPGNYMISVSNANGTSGALTFTVVGITTTPSPSVSYLAPSSGAIGTQVTIYGSGFTSTNNRIQFGSGSTASLNSNDGNTLTFTIPSYVSPYCPPGSLCPMYVMMVQPGTYNVSVINDNGTSNTVQFVVTSGNSNQAPSISNFSGPTTLSVGQSGTWSISASDTNNGSLNYSVTWGDENNNPYAMTAAQAQFSQTTTFSHAYYQAGVYTVTVIVHNQQGLEARTTMTVRVI